MKQETLVQKVLIVLLLSLGLIAFVSVALLQLNQNDSEKHIEKPIPVNEKSFGESSYNEEMNTATEEFTVSEIFEKESVSSEEDLLLLEVVSLEEDMYVDQDMKDMERDIDFMLAE